MTEEDKTGLKIKDILENIGHCIWGKSTLEDKQQGKTLFCWQRIKGKQLDYCLMIFLWSSRRWRICLPRLLCLKSQDQYLEWDVPLSRGTVRERESTTVYQSTTVTLINSYSLMLIFPVVLCYLCMSPLLELLNWQVICSITFQRVACCCCC